MVTSKKTKTVAFVPPPKKTAVFWKPNEKAAIVEHAAKAFRSGAALTMLQALHAGQAAAMPEDRRRSNIHTVGERSGDAWFRDAFTKELARQNGEAERQAAPPDTASVAGTSLSPPTEATVRMAQLMAEQAPHQNGAAGPAELTAESVVTTNATEIGQAFLNLRAMLVDELASVFVEAALKAIGSTQFGEQLVRLTEAGDGTQPRRVVFQRTSTVRKPSVLVVGLKGAQKTEILRDYGTNLDLRFVGSDESKDMLRSMTEKAETTIVMTDFISHSHEDIVKARSPNFIRTPGGMTHLRSTLAGLAR